ncbi:hypothetical protein [Pseudomonas sp. 5P_3.1_Bac2]|uniref:hypothetical protein n=1 Tax=Pseudomonas sp. 5P_3.1_Bac2 TaxID=2971617 RepID=UPI0021CAB4D4|nr:hypothetical protein [Pseudomonas sp. 5P_3.1_Bac2]MCU1716268.1 hypothetical protein [Pseudomonas sp. 5P_3.1_Bac2]
MLTRTVQGICLAGLTLVFSAAVLAAQPGAAASGAPGTPTPAPYGQAPAAAVYGGPSARSTGSAPLLPALPRVNPAPATDQGLPQLRQPQAPVKLPKAGAAKP